MNIFDLLPNDILRHILLLLEPKSIKNMFNISDKIKTLDLQEILSTRKFIAFPRSQGHCLIHYIPANIFDLSCENKSCEPVLQYLNEIEADLVKGDLIKFDLSSLKNQTTWDGKCLFNGNQLVNIEHPYQVFYDDFNVIINNVPIKYWENINESGFSKPYVWFNQSIVLDQCLANIKYELVNDKYLIYTTFTYNKIVYRIIFDYICSMISDIIDPISYRFLSKDGEFEMTEIFKRLLSTYNNICFIISSNNYENPEDNCLFMDMNYILELEWWKLLRSFAK